MAPNRKKKKPAANPARGFATVSQPSKAKDIVNEDADAVDAQVDSKNGLDARANQTASHNAAVQGDKSGIEGMTPDELEAHLEESSLRSIVESSGNRCKQDVERQIARLHTERRQLRLPTNSYKLATAKWLSEDLLNIIISKHESALLAKTHSSEKSPDSINEEFLLVSLWSLKRVLAAFRFTDVDQALVHVLRLYLSGVSVTASDYIWGLAEALEWYAVNSQKYELRGYDDNVIVDRHDGSDDADEDTVQGKKPEDTDKHDDPSADSLNTSLDDVELSPLPTSASDDDDDPTQFIERYCRLQSHLFRTEQKIKKHSSSKLSSRKSVLINKISRLAKDPMFDLRAAELTWQSRRRDLEIDAAQEAKHEKLAARLGTQSRINPAVQEDDDEIFSVMFTLAEDESSSATNDNQTTIEIIDFGTWSGARPRKVLEDACNGIDAILNTKYAVLASSSFATRHSLEVVLSSNVQFEPDRSIAVPSALSLTKTRSTIKLEMSSKAAATSLQSESYISTAMFFVLSTIGLLGQNLQNRLPTVWRTIFQELCDDQKKLAETEAITSLKNIRIMIDTVVAESKAQTTIESKRGLVSVDSAYRSADSLHLRNSMDEDQARAIWAAKASSEAYQSMLSSRTQLPVYQYKSNLLDNIQQHPILIVCADTGAGKSTQIPSFILEHELSHGRDCRIIVTQPRRISAITLARRVSRELGEKAHDIGTVHSLVGYAIRLESRISTSTRLTYATTGVLLRMLETSPELADIDCLVLDEVHERTLDLDLLFIVLKKLQRKRSDLKIVLMSATVDARKFSHYFDGAPIIDIPGRTFPVEVKYLEDAVEDTLSLRRGRNPGEAAGRKDVNMIEDDEASSSEDGASGRSKDFQDSIQRYSAATKHYISEMDEYRIDFDLVADVATAIATKPEYQKYSTAILIFLPGIAEIRRLQNILTSRQVFAHGWVVHLLHSSFATDDLEKAFVIPPRGQRKIVISTNIAETGVTIPDVTAVIDTCKEKIMRFDERRQVSKLREGFTSRSSARQRKGRAARVQEGICFHLVTRFRHDNSMLEQHVPEMLRLSLQDAILRIKVWNLGSIEETLSSAIDPPNIKNIRRATAKLKDAGALSSSEKLTPLGVQLSKLPLEVVLGKAVIFGIVFKCLDPILTIVAALSSKSPFQTRLNGNSADPRTAFSRSDSDLLSTLNAFEGWQKARASGLVHQYCRKHNLNNQALSSIEDQKAQLFVNIVDAGMIQLSQEERESTKGSRWAKFKASPTIPERFSCYQHDFLLCTVIAVAFYPRILVREGRGWRNVYSNQQMSISPTSVNRTSEKPPRWLCFYEATQSKSGAVNVLETSGIPVTAIVTVLGGEADFKFFAGTVDIDTGKLRFSFGDWRRIIAIKAIRDHVQGIIGRAMLRPGIDLSSEQEEWLRIWVQLVTGQPPRDF